MTTIIIPAGTSSYYALQSDTTYVLGKNAALASTQSVGLGATSSGIGRDFIIHGDVSAVDYGMVLGFPGHEALNNTVYVGATGSIHGELIGLSADVSDVNLTNLGSITASKTATGSSGMSLDGDDGLIVNRGIISGETGIVAQMSGFKLTNVGKVVGSDVGLYMDGGSGDTSIVVNRGTIKGVNGDAIIGHAERDVVTNFGTLSGSVQLGDGNDLFVNAGGDVTRSIIAGGAGSDTYVIDHGAIKIFESQMDSGVDTIKSKSSFTLANHVEVGRLTGNRDVDLTGTNNTDKLYGNAGDNTLSGGLGLDYLDGGRGNDQLFGGYGAGDIFLFRAESGRDVINGFKDGQDVIDLSGYAGIDALADVTIRQSGSNVVIDLLDGDQIVIKDFDAGNITISDLAF